VAVTADLEGDSGTGVAALGAALATGEQVDDLDLLGNLGNAALHLGDDAAARRFYTAMLTTAQDRGAGMWVVYALQRLAFPQYLAGRWTELRASAEEALALSRSVGQQALAAAPLAWLTLLAALQGRDDYERLLAETQDVSARHSLGILTDPVRDLTSWAQGVRAVHAGDPALALGHLARLRVPTLWRMTTPDRVEAAVRAGDPEQASAWIDELGSFAVATRWPWAQTVVEYGRALLTDSSPDPDQLFARALGSLDGQSPDRDPGRPYDRARVDLAYGEWLRRNRQRVHARRHLRSAMETFTDLQAAPLLARATEELRASGESARKRDPSTLLQLTPMEQKVAQLVSSGLSNKDVATQCWISPRTVAFHLRNVFAKTGVTSRGELAQLSIG
jgi:DNA-binding CsgD family transcriptional regulator